MMERKQIFVTIFLGVLLWLPTLSGKVWAQQPERAPATLTPAQLAELLDRVAPRTEQFREVFKDLTAEEHRHFELFKPDGALDKEHRTVADLIIYQSQRDAKRVSEFRNIRTVDGAPVNKQQERLEKLFERLQKADSADKEMGRIIQESTRYDFGFQLAGYLFFKAIASHKVLHPFFKYEAAGWERIGERDLLVVKFEQTQFRDGLFGLKTVFNTPRYAGPLLRGTYWIDPDTAEIWREHHEIFFRDQTSAATPKVIEADFDFAPSKFAVFLPQRVTLQYFNPRKAKGSAPPETYRAARVTSEFGAFQRFNTEGKQENLSR